MVLVTPKPYEAVSNTNEVLRVLTQVCPFVCLFVCLVVLSFITITHNTCVSVCDDISQATEASSELQWPAGYHYHRYAPTPVMSTYLLAWVVGEFDCVATTTPPLSGAGGGNTLVRVFTPLGKSALAGFALRVSVGALDFLGKYFDIPYALPKVDLLAIPVSEQLTSICLFPICCEVKKRAEFCVICAGLCRWYLQTVRATLLC